MKTSKVLVLLFLLSLVALFYLSGVKEELTLESIQLRLKDLKNFNQVRPVTSFLVFMGLYILITSLSIPGAIILTLLAGTLFGVVRGAFIVTLACTIGATVAFYLSRFLFREAVYQRFREQFTRINYKLSREGNTYLFTLRLVPVSPFVLINLLMGITSIRPWSYIWITFVGMFPGNLIYVFAGKKIAEIESANEILTWPIIFLLTAIGLFPFVLKKSLNAIRNEAQ